MGELTAEKMKLPVEYFNPKKKMQNSKTQVKNCRFLIVMNSKIKDADVRDEKLEDT